MTFKDEKGDSKWGVGGRQILDMALGILADTRKTLYSASEYL